MLNTNRKKQKESTRQDIIDAALKVMLEKGVDNTQISDITSVAGIAQGTFYVHFKSKKELLNYLIDDFNNETIHLIQTAFHMEFENDLSDSLVKIAKVYLDGLEDFSNLIRVLFQEHGFSIPVATIYDGVNPDLLDFVETKLDDFANSADIHDFNPRLLSHAILSMWLRLGFKYITSTSITKDEVQDMLFRATKALLSEFVKGII